MIEPNLINDLPDMIQLAIMSINKPPKAVALELNCSISAIYQALHGKRTLPAKKMRKFAENNFIAAASMAMQATGLNRLFRYRIRYRKTDRHIQARLLELKIYDKKADEAMNKLPELLFNKNSNKDLSESDKKILLQSIDAMIERDNISLNLFMELDIKFNLDLVKRIKKARFDK